MDIEPLIANRQPGALEDVVRPSREEIQRVLERSHDVWSSCAQNADSELGLPLECIQLQSMLGKVPSFPTALINNHGKALDLNLEHRESSNNVSLFMSGVSTWETSAGQCDLRPRTLRRELLFGTQQTTTCRFSEDSRFINWPGIQNGQDQQVDGNYLAVLTCAWAYILSARWIEMQNLESLGSSQTASHKLLQAQVDLALDGEDALPQDINVDIGDVQNDAARWWSAVLARGEGWSASITRNGTIYQSPWSYCLQVTQNFRLRRNVTTAPTTPSSLDDMAPSSTSAMGFLAHFCAIHNIRGQCSAALAAALLFPSLKGSIARLPFPKSPKKKVHSILASLTPSDQSNIHATCTDVVFQESSRIPYYMTLSCNTFGMRAVLCGTFFDPETFCNQVSAWLQPAFEVIDPIIRRSDYEMLVAIMSKRQPRIAGLWLGAIITGLEKTLLQYARAGTPPVDVHAAAWTGTVHSFVSLACPTPPDINTAEISRARECRLLFMANYEDYPRVPICPWQPFGTTMLIDTDIEVKKHATCAGHRLRYVSWRWEVENGASSEDRGFMGDCDSPPQPSGPRLDNSLTLVPKSGYGKILRSESASEVATRSIFSWLRVGGYPIREKGIRTHSWFDFEDSDNEELVGSSDSIYSKEGTAASDTRINDWIDSVEVTWA